MNKKITFVIAYLDPEDPHTPDSHWHSVYEPRHLIRLAFESIKHFHPEAECLLLTDQMTPFDFKLPIQIIRYEVDPHFLMYALFKIKLDYLSKHDFSSPLVYLDYDILLNGSLLSLFKEPFDVGLTYRSHPLPINGGVCFFQAHSQRPAQLFFQKVFEEMTKMSPKAKQWMGDQIGIYSVIKRAYDARTTPEIIVEGISIKLFPCEKYNYCPITSRPIQEEIKGKLILHFKDERKQWMPLYFDFIKN